MNSCFPRNHESNRQCVVCDLLLALRAVTAGASRMVCWQLYTSQGPCVLLPQLVFLALYGG